MNPNSEHQIPKSAHQHPNPELQTLNPKPCTPNPEPQTLNPRPQTLNPKPQSSAGWRECNSPTSSTSPKPQTLSHEPYASYPESESIADLRMRILVDRSLWPLHARPFVGLFQSHFLPGLSTFDNNSSQNCSKNGQTAPRTGTG